MSSEDASSEIEYSERHTQTIVDTIPTLAWCARADGSAEFFNKRWRDYTGLSAAEAHGWAWTVALHPEDIERVADEWRSVVASAKPAELEARLRRHDGAYRWFIFRAAPSLDEQGRVIEWYGTNTDIEDRRRAEEALRASEQNFRLIVESIPGFVCTMTASGEVDFANQRVLDYLGVGPEELKDWPPLLHEDDRARVIDRWNRSVESGRPYEVQFRLRNVDGRYRWFHVRGRAARAADGRIARWYLLLNDIEDQKRAQDTLRESERTLRLLFESIPGMISVHDGNGDLEYVNQRLLSFLGTEFDNLVESAWLNVLHPDEVQAVADRWHKALELGQPMDITFRMRRFDGAFRWCHSRKEPLFNEQGQIVRWYSLVWDIEERKQAEMALQASERELRLLVDKFPGMVAVGNPEGQPEYGNQRLLDFLGTDLAGLRKVGLEHRIHPDELATVGSEWARCTDAGEPMDVTYRLRRFDGMYRWVHSRIEPLLDEQGKILRWYALLVDVDDQKQAAEALRTSESELAHVSRVMAMGEMAASIAHEVSQPLTAVVNNANACLGLLPADVPYVGEVRDALAEIVDDADRAAAVVARVRQLARKAPVEGALLDVHDVVSDVLALLRHEAVTRRVTIQTELPDELPLVLGDRVQLQQVLLNLIVNGMDAMSTVEEAKRVLTIGARCDSRETFLSVQDVGIGFAPEEMDRLFEAFYTTKAQGIGMGLAISRSIVAAHGGRLWAEPNHGPGVTFVLSLPNAGYAA